MGDSSGGPQNTVSEFKPPDYTQPGWQGYVQSGISLANRPYSESGIPTVAPLNDVQNTGLQFTIDRALQGAPDLNAGRGAVTKVASGQAANPFMDNAYTDQLVNSTNTGMIDAFKRGTAAQTDASMARGGAYGGSAYNEQQAVNAGQLAQQVGAADANIRSADLTRKGNLYQGDVNNQLSAAGLSGSLSADDWTAAQKLTGAGDAYGQYNQTLLDSLNNEWGKQQMYDATQNEYLGNVLSRASGGQGQQIQTQNAGGYSPLANLLGGGAAAYGAYKAFGS